jgi:signal transduction histidine kinase
MSAATSGTPTTSPTVVAGRSVGDPRVVAVLEVLNGECLAAVADRHGVAPELLERWVASFVDGGAQAVAGIEADRQTPERFLTVLAHEVRTPLAAAIAGLRLLGDARLDVAARRDVHEMISARLSQLSVLCGDVLDAASVVLGRLSLLLTDVDLRAAADMVIATSADLRLRLSPGPSVTVLADRRRVEQIVAGLVDAALRHCVGPARITVEPDGAAYARITVSSHSREVVSPERASAWLEPFEAANDTGNGLSLYVVRALTVAHGGTAGMDCSRCQEGGSDQDLHFWVRLPMAGPSIPVVSHPAMEVTA